jgi:hypothetical protein
MIYCGSRVNVILFSNKTIKKSFYHSRQHREWQIILICRKRYGTTDSPGPCPGLHPQIGMQHKNVFKHFYGILVSEDMGLFLCPKIKLRGGVAFECAKN